MKNGTWAAKTGAVFYALWGVLHVVGAGMQLMVLGSHGGSGLASMISTARPFDATTQVPDVAAAFMGMGSFNILWIGLLVTVVAVHDELAQLAARLLAESRGRWRHRRGARVGAPGAGIHGLVGRYDRPRAVRVRSGVLQHRTRPGVVAQVKRSAILTEVGHDVGVGETRVAHWHPPD